MHPAGTRIGDRYDIVELISSGASGEVYRARGADDRPVALKRLIDPRQQARFEIEGRLLSRLRHPRVVRVLEHVSDESGSYLAMELVEGADLGELLGARGAPGLPLEDALGYGRDLCEALRYVHGEHVVHRDVKPRNLIAGDDGVVLVDFGIAREDPGDDPGTRAVGTPHFMAPEVFVGEGISPRSDVYGAAATIWTLVAGKPPVYHDTTPLAQTAPAVTPQLEHALRAGLELNPEHRLASVDALAAALGVPLERDRGVPLALSLSDSRVPRALLEAIVRAAAGVFDAAASSVALVDPATGELVYQAAWGAGGGEIVGVRMPMGAGIAGAVAASGEGLAVPDCRSDERFAAQVARGTGYVPHTMLVAPLRRGDATAGVISVLDRRDGLAYRPADLARADLFADLTVAALELSG